MACLIGIASRPLGYLSAFWPANAILLGLLLRNPAAAHRVTTWTLCLVAYMLADLITGAPWVNLITLNVANVFGVLCGWLFLRRLSPEHLSFQRTLSVLLIFCGCCISTAGGSLLGGWAASYVFGISYDRAVLMWITGEFYNAILIVPLLLAAPQNWRMVWPAHTIQQPWLASLPLLALMGSEVLSLLVGGPGAIAFIMPAMVWCAMTYGIFPMTLLNLVVSLWKTAVVAMGAMSFTPDNSMEVTSYRTGLALLSLAPLAVSCAYALRQKMLQKLTYNVNHDDLTGVLTRRAFTGQGQKMLMRLEEEGMPVAVLMMDIDHFKKINDQYGHAQGDVVLQEFARIISESMRPWDLMGRVGGEEFAAVLPRTDRQQAFAVGQRLCQQLRNHRFALANGQSMQVTVSIGLHALTSISQSDTIEQLLVKADEALYNAKNNGRDQVHLYGPALAPSGI